MGARKNYTTVCLRKELIGQVKKILTTYNLGYRSIAEFVSEAVRLRVQEVEKLRELRK